MSRYCANCGEQIEEGMFCPSCGAPVDNHNEQVMDEEIHVQQNTSNWVSPSGEIVQGRDGVYRWAYDFHMLTNPTILYTMFKVIGISAGIMWMILIVINVLGGDFELSDFLDTTKVFLIILAGLMVLTVISYLLYALVAFGGKYCVLFEMDEKGITHTQAPKQFEKAQIAALISGLTANNLSTLGNAMLVSNRASMSSEWKRVRSVQCIPHRGVIKVNELLGKNQVYVSEEDYAFVRDYIISHCVNAEIK